MVVSAHVCLIPGNVPATFLDLNRLSTFVLCPCLTSLCSFLVLF